MIKMIIIAVSIVGSVTNRDTDIQLHEVDGFTSIEVCEVQKKQVEEQFKEGQSAAVRVTAVCLEVS